MSELHLILQDPGLGQCVLQKLPKTFQGQLQEVFCIMGVNQMENQCASQGQLLGVQLFPGAPQAVLWQGEAPRLLLLCRVPSPTHLPGLPSLSKACVLVRAGGHGPAAHPRACLGSRGLSYCCAP